MQGLRVERSGRGGHAMLLLFCKQAVVLSVACVLAGCAVKRLEDIIGPPPSITQSDQHLAATSGENQLATGSVTPSLSSADPQLQVSAARETTPSILAVPQFDERAQWQAFHSVEGYDVTNAAGTMCSGRVIGEATGIVMGQRIPLACSDGKIATLQVTGLIAGGAKGLMTIDKVQQSARITDSLGSP